MPRFALIVDVDTESIAGETTERAPSTSLIAENAVTYLHGAIEVGDEASIIKIAEIREIHTVASSIETQPRRVTAHVVFTAEIPVNPSSGDIAADEITASIIKAVNLIGAPIYADSVSVPDWHDEQG